MSNLSAKYLRLRVSYLLSLVDPETTLRPSPALSVTQTLHGRNGIDVSVNQYLSNGLGRYGASWQLKAQSLVLQGNLRTLRCRSLILNLPPEITTCPFTPDCDGVYNPGAPRVAPYPSITHPPCLTISPRPKSQLSSLDPSSPSSCSATSPSPNHPSSNPASVSSR